jgi:HEXXH motif-containing protein
MPQLQPDDSGLKHHLLLPGYFDALADGRGDSDVVRFLWQTQRSRRLLLITALFNAAEERPELLGPLPTAAEARKVLALAQSTDPAAADDLLLDPQVGAWAAYTMRRWRASLSATADVPLWDDFGSLHTLCLVAAARAGLAWRTVLPHRDGRVMIFGTGMARFPEIAPDDLIHAETAAGHITLRVGDSTVELADDSYTGGAQWWQLRRLRIGGELDFTVALDDIDPLRDLADPVPPARLDEAGVATWQGLLDGAWTLLCGHYREIAEAIRAGVNSLVPLPIGDGRETRSASSGEAFGRVMVSTPPDSVTLALSLVHEFQHIKLGGLMHMVQLTRDDEVSCYYAPWRDDPRPVGGLLQGVYAFIGIAAFWRTYRDTVTGDERELADFEYAYARSQAHEGIGVIRASGRLTDVGLRLVAGLAAHVEPWLSEEVDPAMEAGARIVADHHRTGWRIRHHRVSREEVLTLAAARRDGTRPVVAASLPAVNPSPAIRWSHGMIELTRCRILQPEAWKTLPGTTEEQAPEVRAADIALVDGDTESALDGYINALSDRYKDLDVWVGLALAVDAEAAPNSACALRERPELVQALYAELIGPGVNALEIADWLGGALLDVR